MCPTLVYADSKARRFYLPGCQWPSVVLNGLHTGSWLDFDTDHMQACILVGLVGVFSVNETNFN